jgi:hypothetical protein
LPPGSWLGGLVEDFHDRIVSEIGSCARIGGPNPFAIGIGL